ncbi:hypothetical protein [Candidatus Magnetominusculus xianensis]|uniref:Uncharacterized protein n=1 Tax=Candidatus Magnetominusculus xianensis TaxID=1748249 RepID=A0ABR5SFG4_9BACT|nr:hypothetical protein [Candidatus Magnetominusculus xianensis]KWT76408.1 hypothetical protein ASN18_3147 [Candidatus Magnetominusculus xianensis]MBF0404876.1 hypothetical protein [Nitrospirota bacterium]
MFPDSLESVKGKTTFTERQRNMGQPGIEQQSVPWPSFLLHSSQQGFTLCSKEKETTVDDTPVNKTRTDTRVINNAIVEKLTFIAKLYPLMELMSIGV